MDDLKSRIVACMDELQFLDFLGLDMEDLVEALEDYVEDRREELERALA